MSAATLVNHAHVFPESVNPNGTIDRLLRLMDACEIEGAVCFAPFAHQLSGSGLDGNTWLAREIASRPRLLGFGTIDFSRADLRDQVRRAAEIGFRGLKLHPNAQSFAILDPRAQEVYAAAQDLDLLITFHTGVHHGRIQDYRVLDFDEVARRFPGLRFTMEHMGGYHFFNEALAVLFNNYPPPWIKGGTCRVFAGLTSIFTQHQNRFWYLRKDQVMEIILQTSADQVIFGLDFPYNLERETKIALDTIASLEISEAERAKIVGGNLARELKVVRGS